MSLLKRIGGSGPLDGQNVDSQHLNTGQLGGAPGPAPAPGTTVLPRQQTGRVGAPTEDSSRRPTGVTTQESMLELKKRVQQKLIAELDPKLDLTKTDEVRRNCLKTHFSTKRDNALYEGYSAGMGLGLSFVAMVLEHHGGTLEIESAPLRGTTFRVRFPLAAS